MNKLVVVGSLGRQRAYLNVGEEEAERRFRSSEDVLGVEEYTVETFEFRDEFGVYSAWPIEGPTEHVRTVKP